MKLKNYFAVALMASVPMVNAEVLFSDTFTLTANGPGAVGYLDFSLDSQQEVDIFTDGPTTDPQIFLFSGLASELTPTSLSLANDDDSCPDGRCGVAGSFNNALINDFSLDAGSYTVAVSDFLFTEDEARTGNKTNDLTGDIVVSVATADFISQTLLSVQDVAQVEQQQEQNDTNTRITNSVVANRVANIVSTGFGIDYQNSQYQISSSYNTMAASADSASNNDYSPDVFWGKHVYTSLTEDGSNSGFDTELYHFIGGLDKRIGDFYIGSALTYVYGQTRESISDNSTHSVGITPYVAYKINNFLFASALAGYNYTSINGTRGSRDADVHDYSGELNINAFKGFGSFWVKGRGGLRYTHNVTSLHGSVVDGDYDQLTWIGDVEFGYNINEKINVFTGVLYEYTDREATIAGTRFTNSNVTHDGVAYFRAGVNYNVNNKLSLGFDASSDLNDEDNNNLAFGFGIRIVL